MSGHRDVWFLYHVPKTGEQTLRNHVRSRLDAEAHVHLGRWSATDPPGGRAVWQAALERADLGRARVLTGHHLSRSDAERFPDARVREVLVLRDPLARLVSHWRFACWSRQANGHPAPAFGAFVDRQGRDPMTAWVGRLVGEERRSAALDAALHALEGMTVVTVLEDLDRVTPWLLAAMGLGPELPARANRAGVDYEAPAPPGAAELERALERLHRDVILHRAAAARTPTSIERLRALAAGSSSPAG